MMAPALAQRAPPWSETRRAIPNGVLRTFSQENRCERSQMCLKAKGGGKSSSFTLVTKQYIAFEGKKRTTDGDQYT